MSREQYVKGEMRDGDTPDWAPLEALLGSDELCAHFMWMFKVELEDGAILNAYKHRWTKRGRRPHRPAARSIERSRSAWRLMLEDIDCGARLRWRGVVLAVGVSALVV